MSASMKIQSRIEMVIRFFLLCTVLIGSGCNSLPKATPMITPTIEPVEVQLVPFASESFRIQGVIPQGWVEVSPGMYARNKSPEDQTGAFLFSYPNTPREWGRYVLKRSLLIPELPPSIGSYQTTSLDWDLYKVESTLIQGKVFDFALAEADSVLYLVVLQALKEDYEALHRSAFLPIIDALKPIPVVKRDKVTAADLNAAEYQGSGPVYNAYFALLGEYSAAKVNIEGKLTVEGFKMSLKNIYGQPTGPSQDEFPGFTAQFFTYEDTLVPVQQEILPAMNKDSFWKIILSPGKVWSEPGDGGMSRAAFPFVLVATDSNETHNGIATFLYNDTSVSSFRFQVVQETAAWNKFDAWGQHTMSYTPATVENREELLTQFSDELSHQIPIHPWSELEKKYNTDLLSTFTGAVDRLDISTTGLIVEDTIYMQPCYTRYGEFPFCQYMRHGAFSMTKPMGAAVAMLRLAEKYGEGVLDLKVSDYVNLTASHDGWKDVTFGNALNQATGIGDDPDPNVKDITAEETQPKWQKFASAKSAQEKLDIISTYGKYPWGAGKVARYNSTNTFVLSVAMDRFLKSKEGPNTDIWDMVLEEVYKPIGIYHAPIMRSIEPDGNRGVPIFGYGLYPTVEDMAKVALLFRNNGQYQGHQLLHAGKLSEALLHIKETGLPTGESNGSGFYHLSFWAEPYRSTQKDEFMIPYMSGFGGNRVVFNPNGIISFRFTDAVNYELDPLVKVADGIEPFTIKSDL